MSLYSCVFVIADYTADEGCQTDKDSSVTLTAEELQLLPSTILEGKNLLSLSKGATTCWNFAVGLLPC